MFFTEFLYLKKRKKSKKLLIFKKICVILIRYISILLI